MGGSDKRTSIAHEIEFASFHMKFSISEQSTGKTPKTNRRIYLHENLPDEHIVRIFEHRAEYDGNSVMHRVYVAAKKIPGGRQVKEFGKEWRNANTN